MKRFKTLLLILVLFVGLITVTGCDKLKNPAAGFKNPRSITYKSEKGTLKLTYDDDGTYEVIKNDPHETLKNKNANFRIDMEFSNNTLKQQETAKANFKKDKRYTIIDVEFNGYKGYAMVQNEFTTTNIYLTLDEKSEVISNIKVSPVMTNDAVKKLDSGTKPEDVLFNQEKVQKILKTVQYEKNKNSK